MKKSALIGVVAVVATAGAAALYASGALSFLTWNAERTAMCGVIQEAVCGDLSELRKGLCGVNVIRKCGMTESELQRMTDPGFLASPELKRTTKVVGELKAGLHKPAFRVNKSQSPRLFKEHEHYILCGYGAEKVCSQFADGGAKYADCHSAALQTCGVSPEFYAEEDYTGKKVNMRNAVFYETRGEH